MPVQFQPLLLGASAFFWRSRKRVGLGFATEDFLAGKRK